METFPQKIVAHWAKDYIQIWALAADGTVIGNKTSPCPDNTVFVNLISEWLDITEITPVLIAGPTASATDQDLSDFPQAPTEVIQSPTPNRSGIADNRISVFALPGIIQRDPFDIMHGEETLIAGFLSINPKFDGVLCIPGKQTKWVHISASEIVSFKTFLTQELLSALQSENQTPSDNTLDQTDFLDSLDAAIAHPTTIAAQLFSLKAEARIERSTPNKLNARLLGTLIGAELAASKPYWLGQQIAVFGPSNLSKAYITALEAQGLSITVADQANMMLLGLKTVKLPYV